MASPRVRPQGIKAYPSLQQIDTLENYIYAACDWKELQGIYGMNDNDQLVLAVFAYEHRPAFKTPHRAHADFVYSRTGIARAVNNESISLVKSPVYKSEDAYDDRNDKEKVFLQPIRKVFNDDMLLGNGNIQFAETHISEKLKKFANWENTKCGRTLSLRHGVQKCLLSRTIKYAARAHLFLSSRNLGHS